jgi:SSS family solute:Na+ symporter
LIWGIVQIGVAVAVRNQPGSALSMALSIASLFNGPLLGVFLVGTLMKRVSQPPALIGMLVSLASMIYVFLATKIAWTWYAFLGSLITVVVAWAASFAFSALPLRSSASLR